MREGFRTYVLADDGATEVEVQFLVDAPYSGLAKTETKGTRDGGEAAMTDETRAALRTWLKEAQEAEVKAQSAAYCAIRARYAAELAVEVAEGRGTSIEARLAWNYLTGAGGPEWEGERKRLLEEQKAERVAERLRAEGAADKR